MTPFLILIIGVTLFGATIFGAGIFSGAFITYKIIRTQHHDTHNHIGYSINDWPDQKLINK